jgi:dTMP kinase
MDLRLATDPAESFRLFQSRVLELYDEITGPYDLRVIDATGDITSQQKSVRRMVREILHGYRPPAGDKNGR